MKQISLLIALFFATIAYVTGQTINNEKSVVDFKISEFGIKTVRGTFGGMKGEIHFDTASLSSSYFDVCIDASTVCTGIKRRDEHLKNKDFFEVEKYPVICFKSDQIIKTSDGYITNGKLTMHGVTREIAIPFRYAQDTFKGTLTLKRLDYKIGENTGTFLVNDEVTLSITCYLKQ